MYDITDGGFEPIGGFPFFVTSESGDGILVPPCSYHLSQLLFVRRGDITLSAGTVCHAASAGDILYIPEETLTIVEATSPAAIRRFVFHAEDPTSDIPDFERGLLHIRHLKYRHTAIRYPAVSETAKTLSRIADKLYEEWQSREIFFRLAIRALLSEAVATMLRDFAESSYREERTAYKNILRLAPALSYMDAHMAERIYVGELAAETLLSPDHFEKLFRETLGLPPMEYLLHIRMNAALRSLSATRDSVTRIARENGISGATYLTRRLTEALGRSPAEIRALIPERVTELSDKENDETVDTEENDHAS